MFLRAVNVEELNVLLLSFSLSLSHQWIFLTFSKKVMPRFSLVLMVLEDYFEIISTVYLLCNNRYIVIVLYYSFVSYFTAGSSRDGEPAMPEALLDNKHEMDDWRHVDTVS